MPEHDRILQVRGVPEHEVRVANANGDDPNQDLVVTRIVEQNLTQRERPSGSSAQCSGNLHSRRVLHQTVRTLGESEAARDRFLS